MEHVGCVTLAARGLGKGPAGPRFRPPFLEPAQHRDECQGMGCVLFPMMKSLDSCKWVPGRGAGYIPNTDPPHCLRQVIGSSLGDRMSRSWATQSPRDDSPRHRLCFVPNDEVIGIMQVGDWVVPGRPNESFLGDPIAWGRLA
eukprot:gene13301-biopygen9966